MICESNNSHIGNQCQICGNVICVGDDISIYQKEYVHTDCKSKVPTGKDHTKRGRLHGKTSSMEKYHGPGTRDDV